MKTRLTTIALLSAALTCTSPAQEKTTDPNLRPEKKITILTDEGKQKEMNIPAGKYLSTNGTLSLYPGDTVHLEFEQANGKLARPKVVATVSASDRTITFAMTNTGKMTMLKRSTSIQQTVALDCEFAQSGSRRFYPTNLYPTEKGMIGSDSWPNTVWALRLSNIEVTSAPADEVYQKKVSR